MQNVSWKGYNLVNMSIYKQIFNEAQKLGLKKLLITHDQTGVYRLMAGDSDPKWDGVTERTIAAEGESPEELLEQLKERV